VLRVFFRTLLFGILFKFLINLWGSLPKLNLLDEDWLFFRFQSILFSRFRCFRLLPRHLFNITILLRFVKGLSKIFFRVAPKSLFPYPEPSPEDNRLENTVSPLFRNPYICIMTRLSQAKIGVNHE
jgi:hypothetical protein